MHNGNVTNGALIDRISGIRIDKSFVKNPLCDNLWTL